MMRGPCPSELMEQTHSVRPVRRWCGGDVNSGRARLGTATYLPSDLRASVTALDLAGLPRPFHAVEFDTK